MRAFAQQMTERMKAVAAAGAVAAFWLAVWMLVAALVAQPLILPGPGAVALALLRLVCDGGAWAILAGSGARILGGLALAAVCGGVLAGISSRSRAFARLVAPALSFVKATPVACVVVLLLIWLGSARVSIAAVFLMALPGVYFSLAEGLAQVNKPLEQMFRLHGVRGWRLFCVHTWREVLPFVLSCARAVIGMSWKAGVAAELIGMAAGTVGERIYQAKLLIETADLLAWTVLVVAASWACERVLVWLLRVSGPVAWRAAVRAHGHGLRGCAGAASGGTAAELALAVGDRAPWAPALDGLVLRVPAGGRACVMGPRVWASRRCLPWQRGSARRARWCFRMHAWSNPPRRWITCWYAPMHTWTPRVPLPCCACWCRESMRMRAWPSFRVGSAVASKSPEPCCVRATR